jgi:hypothetical protein
MTDLKFQKNIISLIIACSGAFLIGIVSHPSGAIESFCIIFGIVLIGIGGIMKGSISD